MRCDKQSGDNESLLPLDWVSCGRIEQGRQQTLNHAPWHMGWWWDSQLLDSKLDYRSH